jgi:hypothetical protein
VFPPNDAIPRTVFLPRLLLLLLVHLASLHLLPRRLELRWLSHHSCHFRHGRQNADLNLSQRLRVGSPLRHTRQIAFPSLLPHKGCTSGTGVSYELAGPSAAMARVDRVEIYRLRSVSSAALDFDSILPLAFRRCP